MEHRIPGYIPFRLYYDIYPAILALLVAVGIVSIYFPIYSVLFSYILLISFVYGLILAVNFLSKAGGKEKSRISYNERGFSVNGRLKYAWEDVRNVTFSTGSRKITLKATLTPRYEFIPELTHTLKYGVVEVFAGDRRTPVLSLKTTHSIWRQRNIMRRMRKLSAENNREIEFEIKIPPDQAAKHK